MTTKELAGLLDGNEYTEEIDDELAEKARGHGLVVVFGASDDLIEFRGAINDETGTGDGDTVYIDAERGALLRSKCDCDDCPYFEEMKQTSLAIGVSQTDDGAWAYEIGIPHDTFDIMEDGETYCRGIVFAIPVAGRASEDLPL